MNMHADDVGLTENNLKKTVELYNKQNLESISILANGPFVCEACSVFKKTTIPIFLHFNLIEGKPITNPLKIPTLVDQNGFFYPRLLLTKKIIFNQINIHQIEVELLAQIQKLKQLGITIAGIDSHQHLHGLSPVAEIVTKHRLLIRSYKHMKTQTTLVGIKLALFTLLSITSYGAAYKKLGIPITWKLNSWKPFYVASWEKINIEKNTNFTIVTHPGLPYDL